MNVRAVFGGGGEPSRLEVVLQEETRGLADLILGTLALGEDEGEVVVEVGDLRALLQALVHLGRWRERRDGRVGEPRDRGAQTKERSRAGAGHLSSVGLDGDRIERGEPGRSRRSAVEECASRRARAPAVGSRRAGGTP